MTTPPDVIPVSQTCHSRPARGGRNPWFFSLLPISDIKPHEAIIPERMEKIKIEILASGQVSTPLWVEKKHLIVLNGHHRLAALKQLGCQQAPCLLLDYFNGDIEVQVCPGSMVETMTKELVIQAALNSRLFPPRSSLHTLKFIPPSLIVPISQLI